MQNSAVFHMQVSLDQSHQNSAGEESVGFYQLVHSASPLKKTQRGFRSSPFRDDQPVSSTTACSRRPPRPAVLWHGFICICQNVSSAHSVCHVASAAPLLIRAECSCEPRGVGSAWKEELNSGNGRRYVVKHYGSNSCCFNKSAKKMCSK